jgi:hypothetical protein
LILLTGGRKSGESNISGFARKKNINLVAAPDPGDDNFGRDFSGCAYFWVADLPDLFSGKNS